MKALSLLYKEAGMPRIVRGSTVTSADVEKYLKTQNKIKPKQEFSMGRVLNGVRWGGTALGLGAAGYVAANS